MVDTISSITVRCTIRHLKQRLAPLLHRGFRATSGERLWLTEVKRSQTVYLLEVTSDVHDEALSKLEQGIRQYEAGIVRMNTPYHAEEPEREQWAAALYQRKKALTLTAGLEAFALPGRRLRLDFIDGYSPVEPEVDDISPIGSAFAELVQHIRQTILAEIAVPAGQAKPPPETGVGRPAKPTSSFYVPTQPQALARWLAAYAQIIKLRRKYHKLYQNGDTEQPQPTMDDYRDALTPIMGYKPSAKTVSRIIEAGDAGELGLKPNGRG